MQHTVGVTFITIYYVVLQSGVAKRVSWLCFGGCGCAGRALFLHDTQRVRRAVRTRRRLACLTRSAVLHLS